MKSKQKAYPTIRYESNQKDWKNIFYKSVRITCIVLSIMVVIVLIALKLYNYEY